MKHKLFRLSKNILLITLLFTLTLTSCKEKIKSTSILEEKDGREHISTDSFKEKIALEGAQLVDVRTPIEYDQGHIENATLINFNNANFLKNATETLDKSKPVYVYCLSGGKRSQTSVELLRAEGYDVYDLKGGIAGWIEKGFKTLKTEIDSEIIEVKKSDIAESVLPIKETTTLKEEKEVKKMIEKAVSEVENKKEIVEESTQVAIVKKETKKEIKEVVETVQQKLTPEIVKVNTADFKSKIDSKNVQLIDVRTPGEYKNGHISNAKNINIYDNNFLQQTALLNKSKPVFVYCRSGVRSMKAANKLKDAGFKVYNLNGGIKAWQKEGNKTEK